MHQHVREVASEMSGQEPIPNPNVASPWFWDIIERAQHDPKRLRDILWALSRDDVDRFKSEFDAAATELQDEPFTDYMDPEESEDGVEDIASWVVSQGEAFYRSVFEDPSRTPEHIDVDDASDLTGVAEEVYYQRFGDPPMA
jgi:hypothetical protein